MWNYQKPKKSKKNKSAYSQSSFHLKRVEAQITLVSDNSLSVDQSQNHNSLRVFLNDITPKGLLAFSQVSITANSTVKLALLYNKPFYCKAKVIGCNEYLVDSIVLSEEEKYKYRLILEYIFENDIEKQRIKNFIKSLSQDELIRKAK
jgi:hypothetical protein